MSSSSDAVPSLLPAEDMPVGEELDCGSYEVSERDIIDFARQWDPQYFHVDPQAAVDSVFGGIIASGVHTTAIFQRLAATAMYARYDVIAGKELRRVRFLRPVSGGDMLTGSVRIRAVVPDGRGRCVVTMVGTLRNQHGSPVFTLEVDSLVRSRNPGRGNSVREAASG